MDDQRQGVTPTQHDVLDFLDKYRAEWAQLYTLQEQAGNAELAAIRAKREISDDRKRSNAIVAAARLIDVAERLTKEQTR